MTALVQQIPLGRVDLLQIRVAMLGIFIRGTAGILVHWVFVTLAFDSMQDLLLTVVNSEQLTKLSVALPIAIVS